MAETPNNDGIKLEHEHNCLNGDLMKATSNTFSYSFTVTKSLAFMLLPPLITGFHNSTFDEHWRHIQHLLLLLTKRGSIALEKSQQMGASGDTEACTGAMKFYTELEALQAKADSWNNEMGLIRKTLSHMCYQ